MEPGTGFEPATCALRRPRERSDNNDVGHMSVTRVISRRVTPRTHVVGRLALLAALTLSVLPACDQSAAEADASRVAHQPQSCAPATEGERMAYITGWATGGEGRGCAAVREYRSLMGGAK